MCIHKFLIITFIKRISWMNNLPVLLTSKYESLFLNFRHNEVSIFTQIQKVLNLTKLFFSPYLVTQTFNFKH